MIRGLPFHLLVDVFALHLQPIDLLLLHLQLQFLTFDQVLPAFRPVDVSLLFFIQLFAVGGQRFISLLLVRQLGRDILFVLQSSLQFQIVRLEFVHKAFILFLQLVNVLDGSLVLGGDVPVDGVHVVQILLELLARPHFFLHQLGLVLQLHVQNQILHLVVFDLLVAVANVFLLFVDFIP